MKNLAYVLAVALICSLTVSCSKLKTDGTEAVSDSTDALTVSGIWVSNCFIDPTGHAKRTMMTVEEDGSVEFLTNIYTGDDCIVVQLQNQVTGTYKLSESKNAGVFNVDLSFDDSFFVTGTNQATALNGTSTCDKTNWANGTEIDIWQDDSCYSSPKAGTSRFTIGKLTTENGETYLHLGDTSFAGKDSKSEAKRPIVLSTAVYYEKL